MSRFADFAALQVPRSTANKADVRQSMDTSRKRSFIHDRLEATVAPEL